MDQEESLAMAVTRYQAMAGRIKSMPSAMERQAKKDRERYGGRYVTIRRGKAVCEPLKMIRFLVDVGGLNLKEASNAVRDVVRAGECGRPPGGDDAQALAYQLYRETGDVFEAVALTRFFAWALDHGARWEEVRSVVSSERFSAPREVKLAAE